MSFRIWRKERKIKKLKVILNEIEKFNNLCLREEQIKQNIEELKK